MITLDSIHSTLKDKGRYHIAFTGDSITSCEWVHPNWRDIVLYILQMELMKRVDDWKLASWGIRGFNYAFDGATTDDLMKRVDEIVALKPQLVKEGDPDLTHPNQLGNAYIAKVVLEHGFGVIFDAETYIADTNSGQKYPRYS